MNGEVVSSDGLAVEIGGGRLSRVYLRKITDNCPNAKVRGNPDDVARWVDRLERAGNGQMARVAALAWRTLSNDWK